MKDKSKTTIFTKNFGKAVAKVKERQRTCKHNPLDREIDEYENQICGICGKVMKTAQELYPNHYFDYHNDDLD